MLQSGIFQACDSAQADDGEQEEGIVNRELLEDTGSDIGASDICDYGEAEQSQCDSLDGESVVRLTVRRNTHPVHSNRDT